MVWPFLLSSLCDAWQTSIAGNSCKYRTCYGLHNQNVKTASLRLLIKCVAICSGADKGSCELLTISTAAYLNGQQFGVFASLCVDPRKLVCLTVHDSAHFAGLKLFAKEALHASEDQDWLSLPCGTFFLGDKRLGSCLYVREAYVKLAEVLEKMKESGTMNVVISGNPGVGKRYFAIYMLVK